VAIGWRASEPFVEALVARQYVKLEGGQVVTCMSEGTYLYMWELFQDGLRARSAQTVREPRVTLFRKR